MGAVLRAMRARGLTLSETLVALTLLSLLMVAALNIFPTTMMIVRGTRTDWLARSTAQDKLEYLAAEPFKKLALTVGEAPWEKVTLADGVEIELRTTISTVADHPETMLKRIRVEARWDGRATKKSLEQELYVHALRR